MSGVFLRLVWVAHQGRFTGSPRKWHTHCIANEGQAWCGAVHHFRVVRKEGAQGHGDVLLCDGQFKPEGAQRFGLNATSFESRQRRQSGVVPSFIPSVLDVLSHGGSGKSAPLVDFYAAPIHRVRVRPTKVLVQQGLLPRGIHEVLSSDDVGHPLQVVLNRALEIEEGPHLML